MHPVLLFSCLVFALPSWADPSTRMHTHLTIEQAEEISYFCICTVNGLSLKTEWSPLHPWYSKTTYSSHKLHWCQCVRAKQNTYITCKHGIHTSCGISKFTHVVVHQGTHTNCVPCMHEHTYAYKYTRTKTFLQHSAATSLHALENQPGKNQLLDHLPIQAKTRISCPA